ncbi:MAG: hypothetical protein QW353_02385, partial [Candidatus Korarchaeum sp.]
KVALPEAILAFSVLLPIAKRISEDLPKDESKIYEMTFKINEVMSEFASPELIAELSEDEDFRIRALVASKSNIPEYIREKLARDKNPLVRASAALYKLPKETLAKLAGDPDLIVRISVAANNETPPEVLAKLAEDPDPNVRVFVAMNRNISEETMNKLANDKNKYVRSYLAVNESAPEWLLSELIKEGFIPKILVTMNRNTPINVLKELVGQGNTVINALLALSPHTPREVLDILADHGSAIVKILVAGNENTPPETLAKLAKEVDPSIKAFICMNRNTPQEILDELSKDEAYARLIKMRETAPPHILLEFTKDFLMNLLSENEENEEKLFNKRSRKLAA